MPKVAQSLMILLALAVTSVSLDACSSVQAVARSTVPTTTTVPGGDLTQVLSIGYTNSVPETPWWDGWRPPAPPTQRAKQTIVLSGAVLFESGSATFTPAAQSQLIGVLRLAEVVGARVVVCGYTDDVPFNEQGGNVQLSLNRANAVAAWLESHGISAGEIRTHGYGPKDPIASNSTPQGRGMNRRVEVTVTS
jgi:outer membrane protein OmpA-like peptidoglycan-associated protein